MKQYIIIDLSFYLIKNSKATLRFTIGDYLIDDIDLTGKRLFNLYEVSDDIIKLNQGDFKIELKGITSNYMNGFVTKTSWTQLDRFYIIPEYVFKKDIHNDKKFKILNDHANRNLETKRKYSVKNWMNKNQTVNIKRFLKMYTGGYNLIQNQLVNASFSKNIDGKITHDYIKGDLFEPQTTWKQQEHGDYRAVMKYKPVKITSPGYYQLQCKQKYKIWAGFTDEPNGGIWSSPFGYPDQLFYDIIDNKFNEDFLFDIQTKYTQDENQRNYN